jgi:hypothetical protein
VTRSLALGIAALLFAGAACGKYGPPVRSSPTPAANTPAVAAPASAADTEECADPNAPAAASGVAP